MFKGITITAECLPSALNVKLYWYSTHTQDSLNWQLSPKIFRKIRHVLDSRGQTSLRILRQSEFT